MYKIDFSFLARLISLALFLSPLTFAGTDCAWAGDNHANATKRQLVFPKQLSLGELYTYDAADEHSLPVESERLLKGAGHFVGEARGTLSLPWSKNAKLFLFPSYQLLDHPELLLTLPADTFDGMSFGNKLVMVPVDKIIVPLSHMTGLRSLDIDGAELSDQQLAQLKTLVNLESLGVAGNTLCGSGFKDLACLTKLRRLNLSINKLSQAAYEDLAQLKSLQVLILNHCGVNDGAIMELSKLPKLEKLSIGQSTITAKSLLLIKNMKSLRMMDITGIPLAVKDLTILRTSKLTGLGLTDSQMSAKDIDILKQSLPTITVYVAHHGKPLDTSTEDLFAPLH